MSELMHDPAYVFSIIAMGCVFLFLAVFVIYFVRYVYSSKEFSASQEPEQLVAEDKFRVIGVVGLDEKGKLKVKNL